MSSFSGVITAMVTAFDPDGGLDLPGCRRIARHLAEHGSDALVLAGTTGESPTLSDSEKLSLIGAVRDELGPDATLIAGTGSNDTRHSVELTKAATDAGADGVLVVTPYYNKPNPDGIRAHFEAVAAATALPVVIYNIPSRCVINIPPELLAELARIDNVVAVKQANDDEIGAIDGLDLLAGNDNTYLTCLRAGGTGGILVASHLVGSQMKEIADAVAAGDDDRAAEIDAELQPLYETLSVTSNPIPVKTALAMLGLCGETMRLPMVPATAEQRESIRAGLERSGLPAAA